jgi:hypothetical protein
MSGPEDWIGEALIQVPLQPDLLAKLDAWIAAQPTPVSRPEAIRAIVAAGLQILTTAEARE